MKYVFEVHIKPGHTAEQYAAAWVSVSEILQRAPGAQGTRLHRKIGDPHRLLAIASWDAKSSRDAMEQRRDPVVRTILNEAAQHCDIVLIGEFEEPEWVVEPGHPVSEAEASDL
jgi:Antibiotic biosynthesis monooxygenase